jgi:hypothetical protein
MPIELAEVHVQQATRVSCVAACVCMVRRRRGERIDEQAILEEWGSGGPFALSLHARDLQHLGRQLSAFGLLLAAVGSRLLAGGTHPLPVQLVAIAVVEIGAAAMPELWKEPPDRLVLRAPRVPTDAFSIATLRPALEKLL